MDGGYLINEHQLDHGWQQGCGKHHQEDVADVVSDGPRGVEIHQLIPLGPFQQKVPQVLTPLSPKALC